MYIIIIVIVISVVWILEQYLIYYSKFKYLEGIPGPKSYPLIGSLPEVLGLDSTALFYIARKWCKRFPSIYCTRIIQRSIVHLLHPEDIEVLLSSTRNVKKSAIYDFLTPWLKTGLLTSDGSKWHSRRKILTPAFHFTILKQFVPIFEDHSRSLVRKLRSEDSKKGTNITPFITETALHSICDTAMGYSLESAEESSIVYKTSLYRMGELVVYRLMRPWLHLPFLFGLSPTGREQNHLLRKLHSFTGDVIKERRRTWVPALPAEEKEELLFVKNRKRLALLDLLFSVEGNGDIDLDGITEEVDTFMFEGHDTTSMGITFSLLCLANHPDIQNKVYDEMIEIFGESDRAATILELQQMKYLERCIKESLRLYPSVPFISRVLDEPIILRKYVIPAGVTVHVHIFDLHRDPTLYPDPETFDPDRFLPDNCLRRHPFAYIPFSAGPRNCIGQKYALLETKSIISTILRNYKIGAVTKLEDVVFVGDLVLRSKHPIRMKFGLRKTS